MDGTQHSVIQACEWNVSKKLINSSDIRTQYYPKNRSAYAFVAFVVKNHFCKFGMQILETRSVRTILILLQQNEFHLRFIIIEYVKSNGHCNRTKHIILPAPFHFIQPYFMDRHFSGVQIQRQIQMPSVVHCAGYRSNKHHVCMSRFGIV